jgi:hypothetical protein
LGYPFDVIREEVLAKGLADFASGHHHAQYGELTPDEKVLLYCFVNLKKHFFAALATFEGHRRALAELFVEGARLVVIDVGCGPGTACLALADLLPGRVFDYIGVDLAAPMRTKAQRLWYAARDRGLIGAGSAASFCGSCAEIGRDQVPPAHSVLVVFSYCCASHSLTLQTLHAMAGAIQ